MASASSELPIRLEVVAANDDDGTNHKFPSSVHEVLSNDDLLMEILHRLPIISLYLFKSVSKQWLYLITSPSFTLPRTRIPTVDPPSGLFIGRTTDYWRSNRYDTDFVSFDPRIPAKREIQFSFTSEAQIRKSCNGLLLCYMPRHAKYCIYNPLISMFKMLPPKHDLNYQKNGFTDMYMVFDPTKSPCYKVVHVGRVEDYDEFGYSYSNRIQIYSSETGVWSVSDYRFPSLFFGFFDGIYWNGAIHFLDYGEPFHVKLDIVDHPVFTNIQTPSPLTIEGKVHTSRKLFTYHGSLLLLCNDYDRSLHLNIYEMKNEYSKWSVKYFVNLDDMMRPFPKWMLPADDWDCDDILSIVLGEREEDSFMVIELSGKVLQYKFVSETVTKLLDLGKGVCRYDCYEFIASFAHV